ncbi:MAG: phosphatase PAP2 family protein [Bradyrhizobium sp.]
MPDFDGQDGFGRLSSNRAWLSGPAQDLTSIPSYPSRHATRGYALALLLAILVPERYQQMITRAAEYGNGRIVIGAHYATDVVGGRTLALYDVAQLLANRPGYVGEIRDGVRIDDFRKDLINARVSIAGLLSKTCDASLADCARNDFGRFFDPVQNAALNDAVQTYRLPVVFAASAYQLEDVGKIAPEAGYLLTTAFPYLTLEQANNILTVTEGPGGGFLDNGSSFGVYSRLDLYKAAERAIAMAPATISLH